MDHQDEPPPPPPKLLPPPNEVVAPAEPISLCECRMLGSCSWAWRAASQVTVRPYQCNRS